MINMVDMIKACGCKLDPVLFPGKGHIWRQASTIRTILVMFFNEVLGLR
jgi:hypothetical protein